MCLGFGTHVKKLNSEIFILKVLHSTFKKSTYCFLQLKIPIFGFLSKTQKGQLLAYFHVKWLMMNRVRASPFWNSMWWCKAYSNPYMVNATWEDCWFVMQDYNRKREWFLTLQFWCWICVVWFFCLFFKMCVSGRR